MEYVRAHAEINLASLAHNYAQVRSRVPRGTKLMAVVKADGYGHGAAESAETLLACGADAFGTALCEEGIELKRRGITAPVLVLGYTPEQLLPEAVRHGLMQTVFSVETARMLSAAAAAQNTRAKIHIKIDTGMGRLGFLPGSAKEAADIFSDRHLETAGIYTHFATSDAADASFMMEQHRRFAQMTSELGSLGIKPPALHTGNSGAFSQTLQSRRDYWRENNFDVSSCVFCGMIRIGILLYGLLPSPEMKDACAELNLKPAMRLVTRVGMVKTLPAGSGVSYGHSFVTRRETVVATLPVGYADGYPRLLSNKSHVLVGGKRAPLIGAICMDQCMADVTDVPGVSPGDEAVLIGRQGAEEITADELAAHIGTIGYEIICGVGKRVPRIYIKK
ncbi:MAG: alanine racemase [Defluviitaleaceae bacterium]|nr:alanine racemase [Defluviitaleaceae bacterium]